MNLLFQQIMFQEIMFQDRQTIGSLLEKIYNKIHTLLLLNYQYLA